MAEYGLQMYSVRDLTRKGEMKEALRRVSEMGYKFVEFAGFFDIPAEQIKEWLDEYGLEAYCTHVDLDNLEETIAYHKAIGCKHIVLPGTSWKTAEDMENNIKMLNDAQKRLAEEGMTLGYHNHSSEFYLTPYGKVVEDEIIPVENLEAEERRDSFGGRILALGIMSLAFSMTFFISFLGIIFGAIAKSMASLWC